MEKWSSIHNTFKFFKLGRPPQFEVMEESPTWGKRLEMMNRVKNYYKKTNIPAPDFSEISYALIDAKLKDIMASIDSINKGKTAPLKHPVRQGRPQKSGSRQAEFYGLTEEAIATIVGRE